MYHQRTFCPNPSKNIYLWVLPYNNRNKMKSGGLCGDSDSQRSRLPPSWLYRTPFPPCPAQNIQGGGKAQCQSCCQFWRPWDPSTCARVAFQERRAYREVASISSWTLVKTTLRYNKKMLAEGLG